MPEQTPATTEARPVTDIAVRQTTTVTAGVLDARMRYARALSQSGLLPRAYRDQPANVLYAVEYGDMLGIPAMAAVNGIHIIEGKPSASAGLISGLVRRAGHRLRVRGDDQSATAQITRSDDPDWVFEVTWTIERARTAGLVGKDVWKKYPAAMLKARAITEVARDACEEALSGIHYTPEELGAEVNEEGEPQAFPEPSRNALEEDVHDAVEVPVEGRDWMAEVDATDSTGTLRSLWVAARDAGDLTKGSDLEDYFKIRAATLEARDAAVVDAKTVHAVAHGQVAA